MQRKQDREPIAGPEVAQAQMAAFREWEKYSGSRFADLKRIQQPTLVVNGIHDEMIPVANSYWLSENLPNAVLLTYPTQATGRCSSGTILSRARQKHFLPQIRPRHRTRADSFEPGSTIWRKFPPTANRSCSATRSGCGIEATVDPGTSMVIPMGAWRMSPTRSRWMLESIHTTSVHGTMMRSRA